MKNGVLTNMRLPRRHIRTFIQQFIGLEASSSLLLIGSTLVALLWANSPFAFMYHELWEVHLLFGIGDLILNESLLHWINDGLMALFFLVVGLEIKREILMGELSSLRRAMLPAAAALGGMIAPALIFLAVLNGHEGAHGWGIPMATDIAFSLGVLMLLGRRAPLSLKVFLTGLAIVDDLGAVLVIALFYGETLNLIALAIGGGIFLVLIYFNWSRVKHPTPYLLMGVLLWLAFFESGIHATIAGVLLALTIPARIHIDTREFMEESQAALEDIEAAGPPHDDTPEAIEQRQLAARQLEEASEKIEAPLHRIEHALHPLVSFGILPLFALANAGVSVIGGDLRAGLGSRVALGIMAGLLIGKPLGITLLSWLAVKLGIAEKPKGMRWRHLVAASVLAGIGFTMSIFITTLAFDNPERLAEAKIAIIIASFIAGTVGYLLLRTMTVVPGTESDEPQTAVEEEYHATVG